MVELFRKCFQFGQILVFYIMFFSIVTNLVQSTRYVFGRVSSFSRELGLGAISSIHALNFWSNVFFSLRNIKFSTRVSSKTLIDQLLHGVNLKFSWFWKFRLTVNDFLPFKGFLKNQKSQKKVLVLTYPDVQYHLILSIIFPIANDGFNQLFFTSRQFIGCCELLGSFYSSELESW